MLSGKIYALENGLKLYIPFADAHPLLEQVCFALEHADFRA
jgi:hypothetical protein